MADWLETPGSALVPVRRVQPEPGVLIRGTRVAVGLASQAGQALDRATGGSGQVPAAVDAMIGVSVVAAESAAHAVGAIAHVAQPIVGPVVGVIVDPPFVPEQFRLGTMFSSFASRGRNERASMDLELEYTANELAPLIVNSVLDQLNLTELVIEQVDLTRIVSTVLDQIDLTQLVIERVDLDEIVAQVDLDRIIDRIELIEIANYIIDEIDLPKIVRESTGGLASEAVRGVRLQSMEFDSDLSHGVDRMISRKRRKTELNKPGKRSRFKWLAKIQEDLSRGQSESVSTDSDITTGGDV